MKLFRKKIKIPSKNHSDAIIAQMLKIGELDFWHFVTQDLGVKREWSWRKGENFLVFDSEHDYTLFLLKLQHGVSS